GDARRRGAGGRARATVAIRAFTCVVFSGCLLTLPPRSSCSNRTKPVNRIRIWYATVAGHRSPVTQAKSRGQWCSRSARDSAWQMRTPPDLGRYHQKSYASGDSHKCTRRSGKAPLAAKTTAFLLESSIKSAPCRNITGLPILKEPRHFSNFARLPL